MPSPLSSVEEEKKAVCTQITYAWTWAKLKLRYNSKFYHS